MLIGISLESILIITMFIPVFIVQPVIELVDTEQGRKPELIEGTLKFVSSKLIPIIFAQEI